MSLLGNITGGSSLFGIAAQAALGVATGGSSLLVSTALKGVMLSIGDQVLQQVGQQMGLPPAVTDLATAAFHAEAGDVGGAFQSIESASQNLGSAAGLDSFGSGQIQDQAYDAVQTLVDQVNKHNAEGGDSETSTKGAKGQSFLMKLAIAMGKVMDKKMDEMLDTSKQLDQANSSGDKSHTSELSAKISALGQEISMLSNALNNSIKSVGEASATLVRKG